MDYVKYLTLAGVPEELHAQAVESLEQARKASRWLTVRKWRVRLFKAGWIADQLEWADNRLIDAHPDKLDWDIAPVLNVTAQGDNGPWIDTQEGGRPTQDFWLNDDPASTEYQQAVESCYWCKGAHPRSKKARKAWYRRNAGEGLAFRLGQVVDPDEIKIWRGTKGRTSVVAYKSGKVWQLRIYTKLIGFSWLRRIGCEVDNVFCGEHAPRMWYPLPGGELRAPASWTSLPTTAPPPPRKDKFPDVEQTLPAF